MSARFQAIQRRLAWAGLTALGVALPASTLADPADETPVLGAGGGAHRLHFDVADAEVAPDGRTDEPAGYVRVGSIRSEHRLYGQWTVIPSSDYLVSTLTANADLVWSAAPRITVFAGAGAGGITLSLNGTNSRDTKPVVTAQAGAILAITDRLGVELGLRQMVTRLQTERDVAGDSVSIDLNRLGAATLGANLRF